MSKYTDFIKAMQEKYMGVAGGQGLEGVSLTAVAPSGLTNNKQIAVPAGEGAGTGARFMGRSDAAVRQADKPAGIVEEDEMVVEAPMVDSIGGPGRVREGLEVLADMKRKGVARSFQDGTGSGTVGDSNAAWDAWKKKANYKESTHGTEASLRPTFDEWNTKYGNTGKDFDSNLGRDQWESKFGTSSTTTQQGTTQTPEAPVRSAPYTPETAQSLGLPEAPKVKTAAEVTGALQSRGDSRFAETTDKAMADIQNLATGGSEAMKTITEVSKRGLAGQQAARSSALNQNLAQQGVEGGAARVAQAMESRQAGTEQAQLSSNLAVENQQRMERATQQLASFGLQGEQLEEAKHQFDVGVQKWGQEFEEASKQWGANFSQRQAEFTATANQWGKEFAFAQEKFDYSKVMDAVNVKMAAGDYDGVAETFKNLGFNVNVDTLKDKAAFDKLTRDMDNFNSLKRDFGVNSPQAQGVLQDMYKTQNPGIDVSTPEGKKAMDDWVKSATENNIIQSDPVRSVFEAMDDQQLDDMAASWGYEDVNNFTFNGVKGIDAVKNVLTVIANNPNALDDPNSAISKLISGAGVGGTNAVATGPAMSTDELLNSWNTPNEYKQDAIAQYGLNDPNKKTFTDDNGTVWNRTADNKWQKAGTPTGDGTGDFDMDYGDVNSAKASDILAQGRNASNSKAFDHIVNTRVETMRNSGDYSSLVGKKAGDPVYDKIFKNAPNYTPTGKRDSGGTWGTDTGRITNPPSKGSVVKIDGKDYIVDSEVETNYKGNNYEYIWMKDPSTGIRKKLRAGAGKTSGKVRPFFE